MLLKAISDGDSKARKDLFSLLYNELHRLAHSALSRESPDSILQTTALIHETYLKLMPQKRACWEDRKHFFSIAGHAMRRILVSEARSRKAAKRGGGWQAHTLDKIEKSQMHSSLKNRMSFDDLERLDQALERLKTQPGLDRMCTVVDLLFFVGMTQEEAADVIGISKATIRRDWDFAKVWLQQEIRDNEES